VAGFLLLIFGLGFVAGWIAGSISATKRSEETISETVVAAEPPPTPTPTIEISTEPTEVTCTEPPIEFYDVPLTENLQEYIMLLCEKEEVPVPLIMAMIEQESSFRAEIVSTTDDYGLMQINEVNHEWLSDRYSVTDFLDPYQNVYCGISIIGGYLREYEDITKALMCYNMGEYGANQLWEKGVESSSYSRGVLAKMNTYEEVNDANGNHS
jgi:hypothetical protein